MLTERKIRDAKPANGNRAFLWDGQLKGLGVKVFPSGAKSFVLSYRTGGRKRMATLARCSEMSLREARERAALELIRIRDGEADPLERRRESREAPTIDDGLQRFFDEYAKTRIAIGRMAGKTLHNYRNQAKGYILPKIGNRKVADVKRYDIEQMVSRLPNIQRNRVLALTSRLFNLFETWEWRPQHTNPCRGIERAKEEPRDRVLSPDDMARLAAALNTAADRHPGPVAATRLAALTGLRIGEILGIRWSDIDFQTGRLTLPATKTGRRVHDLPTAALHMMTGIPKITEWVCTTGRGPLGYSHCRKVFAEVVEAAGLSDVRLHDLRRTVMTNAVTAGVGTHVLRDLLGHKTTAMADRYVRSIGNPVREARERVGAAMAAQMEGKPAAQPETLHG